MHYRSPICVQLTRQNIPILSSISPARRLARHNVLFHPNRAIFYSFFFCSVWFRSFFCVFVCWCCRSTVPCIRFTVCPTVVPVFNHFPCFIMPESSFFAHAAQLRPRWLFQHSTSALFCMQLSMPCYWQNTLKHIRVYTYHGPQDSFARD